MRSISGLVFLSLAFLLISFASFSQVPDDWLQRSESITYPKLYLHTDREVYFPGDSIWFKAYYLDGRTQNLYPGDYSLYAHLVDEQGKSIYNQVLLLENGQSAGKMELPDSLDTGNYLLRAFTDEQRDQGENAFFHKKLKLTSVESRMDRKPADDGGQPADMDLAFLPEGGLLLAGQMNVMGVKAIDEQGRDISLRGEILDGHDQVVASFDTEYKGMGAFRFMPRKGESYHARILGRPESKYLLDEAVDSGIKIEHTGESEDHLLFRICTNSVNFHGRSFHFAILHKGRTLFLQEFVQKGPEVPLRIEKTALAPGINRFVLLDQELRPVSERLYFSDNIEINDIQVFTDKKSYSPRSEVQVELFNEEELGEQAVSNLSLAVVDAYALSANGPRQNILSWLLIDSELKGNIESPAHFFRDDDYASSKEKLNLLMLTHGWSRYIWTALAENPPEPGLEPGEGISLEGTVKHAFTKKPVPRGKVDLIVYSADGFVSAETRTDKEGRFTFNNLLFTDTASVFIQGRNKKGKLYTVLEIDSHFKPYPPLTDPYVPKSETLDGYSSGLYEQKYYSDQDLKNFVLENGSILLEEVSITKKRETGDGHFRMYLKPYNSLKITNKDYGFQNVGQYLQGRVSGVTVLGNDILIRARGSFTYSPPLFLMDGSPMPGEVIMSIPMSDIDVVEVLKDPAELGIFGVNAGNGVISVFTKRGGASLGTSVYLQGTISQRLNGYASYKEFYSPKYTPENQGSERPDHRLTLYWNPYVYLDNGRTSASFYTSDDIAHYLIFVEGITNTGEICLGFSEIKVEAGQADLDR